MPYLDLRVELTTDVIRALKGVQSGLKGGSADTSQDATKLIEFCATFTGELLRYRAENIDRGGGKIELVVHDEGRRHYSCHRHLDDIIPFHLLGVR